MQVRMIFLQFIHTNIYIKCIISGNCKVLFNVFKDLVFDLSDIVETQESMQMGSISASADINFLQSSPEATPNRKPAETSFLSLSSFPKDPPGNYYLLSCSNFKYNKGI